MTVRRNLGTKPQLEALSRQLHKAGGSLKKPAVKAARAIARRADQYGEELTNVTSNALEGAAGGAAHPGHLARGVLGWVTELSLPKGGAAAARAVSAAFARLADQGTGWALGLQPYALREAHSDPQAAQLGVRLFGEKGQQLKGSAEQVALQGRQFVAVVEQLAAQGDAALGAQVVNSVAGQLAKAAALTTSAASVKMGEFGVKLSRTAQQAADRGASGADALTVLAARFTASTAEVLQDPNREHLLSHVREKIDAAQGALSALGAEHPELGAFLPR
ncbi:MAG: hypothetical protein IPJ65_24080 [Archangiaceae bacterium]|nr:hypothetical protein [Archangiaceae bacterium]